MEAKELRIGNWIKLMDMEVWSVGWPTPNEPFEVDLQFMADLALTYNGLSTAYLEPIPLTQEWLEKFGFTDYEWCSDCAFIKCNGSHMMLRYYNDKWHCTKTKVSKDSKGHKMSESKDIVKKGQIKYVHQLQNLYFALTGKELTLNT